MATTKHTTLSTDNEFGTGKKSFKVYFTGFILCILLTLIPFWLVMHHSFSKSILFLSIMVAAIIQFLVQVYCFLRLNAKTPDGKVNILSFCFAILVLFILVGGSMWIMFNLNYHMMH